MNRDALNARLPSIIDMIGMVGSCFQHFPLGSSCEHFPMPTHKISTLLAAFASTSKMLQSTLPLQHHTYVKSVAWSFGYPSIGIGFYDLKISQLLDVQRSDFCIKFWLGLVILVTTGVGTGFWDAVWFGCKMFTWSQILVWDCRW